MKVRLNYVKDDFVGDVGWFNYDDEGAVRWMHTMVEMNPDMIYFFTIEVTDIWFHDEEKINYKALLDKYIEHVAVCEGVDFLANHHRGSREDSPVFTDAEWNALKNVDGARVDHSCSCHAQNRGPCLICRELGCQVWDFNEVAVPKSELWQHRYDEPLFTLDEQQGIMIENLFVPPVGLYGFRKLGENVWGPLCTYEEGCAAKRHSFYCPEEG